MICPHCGKPDVKNLTVHLRFCKSKKNETSTPVEAGGTVVGVKGDIPDDQKTVTQEQIDVVNQFLKGDESIELEKKDEESVEIPGVELRSCVVIDNFNYPENTWKHTLEDLLYRVKPGDDIKLTLKYTLCHEFIDLGGVYRYPSDDFYCILRNYCDIIETEDGQTFNCRKKIQ